MEELIAERQGKPFKIIAPKWRLEPIRLEDPLEAIELFDNLAAMGYTVRLTLEGERQQVIKYRYGGRSIKWRSNGK